MITLIHRHIGTVTLDAVIEETHQAELRITENPVESGAMIGDHAVLMPQTVTI
ncbi:phage baseplate protein, partial [Xylella fastidiosa]